MKAAINDGVYETVASGYVSAGVLGKFHVEFKFDQGIRGWSKDTVTIQGGHVTSEVLGSNLLSYTVRKA